jgi:hypothetical protein
MPSSASKSPDSSPPSRTRTLVRILSIAARNVSPDPPLDIDLVPAFVDALNQQLPAIIDAQKRGDLDRAMSAAQDESMRRGQLAVDLMRYPVLDRRTASARKLDFPGSFDP